MSELDFLREQKVEEKLLLMVEEFRERYPVEGQVSNRITKPSIPFFGREILEMSIAALLQGANLLLSGAKATGKISWQRIWPGYLADLLIIYHLMSTPTAVL